MEEKVIRLTNAVDSYRKLGQERAKEGDYIGALGFLFTAKQMSSDVEIIADIADVYSDMGALDLSVKYWFYYLDKAPNEKKSIAYEELAINFFYMEDFWSSSYYFHQKITADGFISQDGLDPEIIDFFSGEKKRLAKYKIAYPFDRADYSEQAKDAKCAMALGSFKDAISLFEKIPTECLDEETSGEYAISCFMADELDKSIKVSMESLEKDGESITAYCNLSTAYDMKGDKDKGEYYYRKALALRTGDRAEAYKIATCAIEREEHDVIKECLKQIVEERPFDLPMRFFYAIALVNTGSLEHAQKILSENYRIDRTDVVFKFYTELVSALIREEQWAKNLLPLKYVKELPDKIANKHQKTINELADHPEKIPLKIKNRQVKDALEWGVRCKKSETVRKSAYVLSIAYTPYAIGLMLDALVDNSTLPELKRVLIYALIVGGYTDRFSVVAGNYFTKIKPKKLKIKEQSYILAYALCMSRLVFWDVEDLDRVYKNTIKVHKKLSKILTEADVTVDELAALILSECKYKKFNTDNAAAKIFDVKKAKLLQLKKIMQGENDD